MAFLFGAKCEVCQAHRLHLYPILDGPASAPRVRDRKTCTVCDTTTLIDPKQAPGIVCPSCGDVRMLVFETRRRGPGTTARKRKCHHCGHEVRTTERLVSA